MRKLLEFIRSVYVVVLFVVLEAIAISYYAHSTYYTQARLLAPAAGHWLGTDEVGRDILARIVHGARISLPVAFATIAIATVVGGLLGAIAGYGSSGWLAGLLHRTLEPYCRQVHLLASLEGPGYGARVLSGLGPADLLIAIAFPRYSADTVFLARRAHQAGVPLLALTDKRSSPLAPLASVSLYAASESSYFVNSECSTLALIEALASAVAHHSRDPVQATGRLAAAAQPWLHGTAQSRLRPPPACDETPRPAARRRAAANAPSQPSVKPSRKATP